MGGELEIFAWTFALVFLTELGDKTQLAVLALSLKGNRVLVLLGAFLAFSLINGLSSAFGYLLFTFIPPCLLRLASGIAFVLAGVAGLALELTARGEEGAEPGPGGKPSLLGSFTLVSLAELGDKTQLATISSSALTGSALVVALAAISALTAMTALTCALGGRLAGRLHGRKAGLVAYAIFLVAGALTLVWPD